jgi:DNA polymerase III sliding clamp (beta) subunit (PCNA family)
MKKNCPGKKSIAIVRSLPGNRVSGQVVGRMVNISSRSADFQIIGLPADNLPSASKPNPLKKTQLQQDEMAKMPKNVCLPNDPMTIVVS